mmetsp:Transcript_54432/g.125422  ORF Transcript_54432/g.125422 Transcript_54432/m.125422 type:complete len:138 (+) Transcript_54432:750-1163(+)
MDLGDDADGHPQEYNESVLQRFIDMLRNDDAWRSPVDVARQVAALERLCGELIVPRDLRLAGSFCSRPPLITRASTTGSICSTDSFPRSSMCSADSRLHSPSLMQSSTHSADSFLRASLASPTSSGSSCLISQDQIA